MLLRMVYLAIPEMLYEWCTMYAVQVEHVIDLAVLGAHWAMASPV